jgi:hypothetical protein
MLEAQRISIIGRASINLIQKGEKGEYENI